MLRHDKIAAFSFSFLIKRFQTGHYYMKLLTKISTCQKLKFLLMTNNNKKIENLKKKIISA